MAAKKAAKAAPAAAPAPKPVPKPAPAPAATPAKAAAPPTLTLKHLAAELGEKHAMSKQQAETVTTDLVGLMVEHLKGGDRLRLAGLGILEVKNRAARAGRNAVGLGVPGLRLVHGPAPGALAGLPQPDAVFIGGGAHEPGVLDAAWRALPPDGRLVANAVTVESEAALLAARARLGGTLTRLSVERLDAIGTMHGYRPAMTVTQFVVAKP